MKYVVAEIGGRQFKISEGDQLTVDRFDGKINEILLFVDGNKVKVGKPHVSGVTVKTKVLEEGKVKTEVRRFKAKSRYRKKKGHKQPTTTIRIESIEG